MTDIEQLIPFGQAVNLKANNYLFYCGEAIDRFYYIIEGELRALRYLPNGQKTIMMRSNDGEFFAAASLSMEIFPCDGFAPVETRLWSMNKAEFLTAVGKHPELNQLFIQSLASDLKKQCGRIERLRLGTARERVLHFISCETRDGKNLKLSGSLQNWAEELGIEAESLYRTLRQMKEQGEIDRDKKSITLLKLKENNTAQL